MHLRGVQRAVVARHIALPGAVDEHHGALVLTQRGGDIDRNNDSASMSSANSEVPSFGVEKST